MWGDWGAGDRRGRWTPGKISLSVQKFDERVVDWNNYETRHAWTT